MFGIVTLFPELLNYGFYAPVLLRVILGIFAVYYSLSKNENVDQALTTNKSTNYFIKALFIIAGILVFIGLYTQLASIVLAVLFLIAYFKPNLVIAKPISKGEIILLLVISISMMILPAGHIAFDSSFVINFEN